MSEPSKLVYGALKLLAPFDLLHQTKLRVGRPSGDGGYVIANCIRTDAHVYSFGIGRNIDFDLDFATRGHDVFMFDHTIDGLPSEHERFHFFREGISGVTVPEESLYSLPDHLTKLGHREFDGGVLKVDVEGAEWDVFATLSQETLSHFDHILLEAHGLLRLATPDGREKIMAALETINKRFTLYHVHANNIGRTGFVHGFPVCDVLELSFVRTDLVARRPSTSLFPTEYDSPNDPARHDQPLWFFPFLPVATAGDDWEPFERALERMGRERLLGARYMSLYDRYIKLQAEADTLRGVR